ncbi:NAD(P)-binding protein [Cryphonectria parasitica EP155]|uniref:NAD(P)-binding protein n=1 Tax=Cryphonectria parasitica (strain ATCC 38755 / EP155) TaxID=660469 RepID=A0A9P4Y9P3_CRYP1|nr:NAD(P)-binding protein [Cryphonectria parasitica EP155]KAF3768974.1 NAD(P)-binding protein [Cryphonectria parasitica EP155]
MTGKTIVLITGANQGLGFEISKKLATDQKDYHIIMAGRRKEAIEEAAQKLASQGLSVEPLILDVNSDESIEAAAQTVSGKHGHIDVLINNAGISSAPKAADGKPNSVRAEYLDIYNTNVAGTQVVTENFIPLLEKSTLTKRIIFMSSSIGSLTFKATNEQSRKLPWWPYTLSKTAMTMLGLFYSAKFDGKDDWKINICCPGHCATNLNSYAGSLPAEHGAINACRLATLGPDGETNTFTDVDGTVPW